MTELRINAADWNSLSSEDQGKIVEILNQNFGGSHKIVPDPDAPPVEEILNRKDG